MRKVRLLGIFICSVCAAGPSADSGRNQRPRVCARDRLEGDRRFERDRRCGEGGPYLAADPDAADRGHSIRCATTAQAKQ